MAKTLTLNGVVETVRPEFQEGTVGNSNDARLAMYEQIADQTEAIRAEDLTDVTDDMYLNPAGTAEDQPAEDVATDPPIELEDGSNSDPVDVGEPEVIKRKIKVNGAEREVTDDELISLAQKVASADQYLAEASRIYREASAPPQDAPTDLDDVALARAIQLGDEDEAVKAIQSIRRSPPQGEIQELINRTLMQHAAVTDSERFTADYADLLKIPEAKDMVFALDAMYANDMPPTYARFEKAAKAVLSLRGTSTSMDDKIARKASAPKPVIGGSARPAAQAEEREPTVREEIAAMAKSRGQQILTAGN